MGDLLSFLVYLNLFCLAFGLGVALELITEVIWAAYGQRHQEDD